MLLNQTIAKLNQMKLFGLAAGLNEQMANTEVTSLSFEERISLLTEREWTDRENRKTTRLLKEAKLKQNACLEDINYSQARGIDRAQIQGLFDCSWIEKYRNIIICGATGTGKTYLACAFANNACRHGHRVQYYRIPKLLEDLKISKADGSYIRLLSKFGRLRALILDDWGLCVLTEREYRELLEVIEECLGRCSIIITSQLPVEHWHEAIGNSTLADAILDRLIHNAYKFSLKGGSMRKTYGLLDTKSATM